MTVTDITVARGGPSRESLSPAHPDGSAPPSSPNSPGRPATRWSAWPIPTHPRSGLEARPAPPVQLGDLDDPEGLAKAAADSDRVIHLAFQHEVAFGGNFAAAGAADRRAVEAMGAALADSDRPFVLASGMIGLTGQAAAATEDDGLVASPEVRANPAGRRAAYLPCSPCRRGASASARRSCASRRRCMATATTGSWPRSSA